MNEENVDWILRCFISPFGLVWLTMNVVERSMQKSQNPVNPLKHSHGFRNIFLHNQCAPIKCNISYNINMETRLFQRGECIIFKHTRKQVIAQDNQS